ncbi:hypothetical protein FHR99_002346 [Litorivivens lipolytica]|uniref:Transcriptional regulator SutA RNAP-binding domain-containing protein n=1 Tax=Litorivivens lipolytica TaxID=1524264 RepID=A0A7W4Z7J5_9GAMM|nr:hypothetical protein [Litorivivens lipolytica]MBB3048080.1 hypothetical protein [Litorivivens lipolytica]
MSALTVSPSRQQTSHEQLRREIQQQVEQFLARGGEIRSLASPVFQPQRVVSVRGALAMD